MKSLTIRVKFNIPDMDDEYLGDNHFFMKQKYLGNTKEIFNQFFGELMTLEKERAVIENIFTKYEF